jgi:hypothetical protein
MAQTETDERLRVSRPVDQTDAETSQGEVSSPSAPDEHPPSKEPATTDMIDSTNPAAPARRPTKFMADLSRAMQTAAEASRDETMTRFLADSKTVVEEIQAESTVEAEALRRQADGDVAAVREWSKTEISRIREETEARIAARKTALDGEIDAHAAVVEARVQQVGTTVAAYQTEMDEFFQRLMAEADPTRIATMAETMPDPPDLAALAAAIPSPAVEPFDPFQARLAVAAPEAAVAPAPEAVETQTGTLPEADHGLSADQAAEAEAALAARLDFAAAEAEALAFTGEVDDEQPSVATSPGSADVPAGGPVRAELAHSDEGILPPPLEPGRTITRVVVLGLVSVASIATFKRSLARSEGVATVGVASGPDGEFVFTVEHDSGIRIGYTVTSLPGFAARITAESAGTLEITAHDPDTGD